MDTTKPEPKKRGRRKKVVEETSTTKKKKTNFTKTIADIHDIHSTEIIKKKINFILYLKCHIKDIDTYIIEQKWKTDTLTYDPKLPNDILPYSEQSNFKSLNEDLITDNNAESSSSFLNIQVCPNCSKLPNSKFNTTKDNLKDEEINKLKELKLTFYKKTFSFEQLFSICIYIIFIRCFVVFDFRFQKKIDKGC